MDFSSVSMEALKAPEFKSDTERHHFFESMCAGEIPIPIFFQAMGVDFTDEEYVAEAIRIGGIGFLSAAAPGFRVTENNMSSLSPGRRCAEFLRANDQRSVEQVEYVHKHHPYAILGGNAMKKLTGFGRSVKTFGGTKKVQILAAGAGILDQMDNRRMQKFPEMELMPIVSSSTAARWAMRVAKQLKRRVRMVLVELPQFAGGHLGAGSAEEALRAEDFDPVVIREEIKKHYPHLPVVLAGGIAYRNQIRQVLQMGYQGVGIGIRGLMTRESKLSDDLIRNVYLNPQYDVVTNDTSPTGYPGRYLDVPHYAQTPAERIRYVQEAVANCISCIQPGSCLFLKNKDNPNDTHFCIGKDLPRTRLGLPGGTCFVSTERNRLMYDEIFYDAQGNPRVPTLEEAIHFMLTHDAPPMPLRDAQGKLPSREKGRNNSILVV